MGYECEPNHITFLNIGYESRAVVSYWQKYMYIVLLNNLGSLSLSGDSASRLTDCHYMTEILLPWFKTKLNRTKPFKIS